MNGTTTALGSQTSDATMVTGHSVSLPGLITDTTYYYEVQSNDNSGNTTVDNNGGAYYTFTTAAASTGVMHVATIDMWNTTAGPNKFIYTKVTIYDADNIAVPESTVVLTVTLPDGSTASVSRATESEGTVTLKLKSRQSGTYTSNVISVTKDGWEYDEAKSIMLEGDSDTDGNPDEQLVVP